MIRSHSSTSPVEDGYFGGGRSDLRVGLAILMGVVAISAVLTACAVAGRFGFGPPMEPVAYLAVAISAVMILASFLIPFIRNQARAGLKFAAFWVLALTSVFALFKYAG